MKSSTLLTMLAMSFTGVLGGHIITVDFTHCDDPPDRPVGFISGTSPSRYLSTVLLSKGLYRLETRREQDVDVTLYLSADGFGEQDQGESQQALHLHLLEQPDQDHPSTLLLSDNDPLRPDWALSSAAFDDTGDVTSVDPNASVTAVYC